MAVIRAFVRQFPETPLLLIPNGQPNHRTLTLDPGPEHRLAMTRMLAEGLPTVTTHRAELDRPGPHTTLGTLTWLSEQNIAKRFRLLVGADWAPRLHTWVGFPNLCRLVTWCIFPRAQEQTLDPGRTEKELRKHLEEPDSLRISWLAMEPVHQSSSEVRHSLQAGVSPRDLGLPPAVAAWIETHRLYGTGGGGGM